MSEKKLRDHVGRATLQEVAEAAGVTVGTASKALHGQGKLRKETRERVRAEAERLGFRLKGQEIDTKRTIGLLTTDMNGRFAMPFLAGLEEVANAQEQPAMVVLSRAATREQEREYFETLHNKRIDGLVFLADNANVHTPVTQFDPKVMPFLYAYAHTDHQQVLSIRPDDEQGGRLATEYLLRLGRREIAHITGPLYFEAVHMRARGMRQALLEQNIPFSEKRMVSGPWSIEWGYEAVQQMLERDANIDAIFCGSDSIACGVVDALQAMGVSVPEDISVVGFDNWEAMVYRVRPFLTSVDMNMHELGRQAGHAIFALLAGQPVPLGPVKFPCHLVERGSCAPKRGVDAR